MAHEISMANHAPLQVARPIPTAADLPSPDGNGTATSLELLRRALRDVTEIQNVLVTGVGDGQISTTIARELTGRNGCLRNYLVWLATVVETITHDACHDPLSGLPNRTLLMDRLHQAMAHADRNQMQVAVLVIDLDNFKRINDTYGHSAGDQALRHVAASIQSCIRASDTACRYGGDEFVVVLPEISAPGRVHAWAQRLRQCIASPFSWQGHVLRVRASVGIALYPRDTRDATRLLDRADEAMFRVKRRSISPGAASIRSTPPPEPTV